MTRFDLLSDAQSRPTPRSVILRLLRVDRLADVELRYSGSFARVIPYGSEGCAIGGRAGHFAGDQLSGTAQFFNRVHQRSDGTLLPIIDGFIETGQGEQIIFQMTGRVTGDLQMLSLVFDAAGEAHRWLNTELCVFEGRVNHASGSISGRAYVCVSE